MTNAIGLRAPVPAFSERPAGAAGAAVVASATTPTPDPSLKAGRGAAGATGIASGLGRTATNANLEKAGQQFEAVFTGMMMKAMRQANLAEPLFDSQAIDTFRDMQDQKIVQSMAEHAPMGIGKAMTKFLAQAMPSQPEINHASGTAP